MERGDLHEAEVAFFEAWPYFFRVTPLLSAANMIVRARPLTEGARRLCLAVGIYDALLRRASPHLQAPLTAEEEALVHRKRAEAVVEMGRHSRAALAAQQGAAGGGSRGRAPNKVSRCRHSTSRGRG